MIRRPRLCRGGHDEGRVSLTRFPSSMWRTPPATSPRPSASRRIVLAPNGATSGQGRRPTGMCARYTLEKVDDLHARFRAMGDLALNQRFNVAPSQYMPVVVDDGARRLDLYRWGLVPSWAKDVAIGNKMINARGETLAEKPSFRNALKHRRCLVPATGFYEWTGPKTERRPVRIHLKDDSTFAFAGLWERWRDPASGKDVRTFAIITCAPNEKVAAIHDRMPVI